MAEADRKALADWLDHFVIRNAGLLNPKSVKIFEAAATALREEGELVLEAVVYAQPRWKEALEGGRVVGVSLRPGQGWVPLMVYRHPHTEDESDDTNGRGTDG